MNINDIDIFLKEFSNSLSFNNEWKECYHKHYDNLILNGDKGKQDVHGKAFERMICEMNPSIIMADSHIAEWDAYANINNSTVYISMKNCKGRNTGIPLSGVDRQYKHSVSDLEYFVILRGSHSADKRDLIGIDAFIVPRSYWEKQFTHWPEFDVKYKEAFDLVGCLRENDGIWRNIRKELKKDWEVLHEDCDVQINPKRDHHGQKRVQCSISKRKMLSFINNDDIIYIKII